MLLQGGKVLNAEFCWEEKDVLIEEGKIKALLAPGAGSQGGVDISGMMVVPGLVDTHIHGAQGTDVMSGDFEPISKFLIRHGVTSFLPTTMTMPIEEINRVLHANRKVSGAQILGFHLEGPYLNEDYKGAQNEKYIKSPSIDEFKELKNIKIVTVAPEIENAVEFIKNCEAIVSLGHTDSDYECGIMAIENGAECLTHTFNAMPPLHHRSPGLIGAAIEKQIYVQVICDGLHIHKSIIKMLYKTFGPDKMILISDSMCATGLSDGKYIFGGQDIIVKNTQARTLGGALAGSTSTLFECVKKAVEFGIPEKDAFKMASETPAKMLEVKKGKVEKGYDGDFIVTDDKYNIKTVIVNGKILLVK